MKKVTTLLLTVLSILTMAASADPTTANQYFRTFNPGEGDVISIIGNNCRFISSENGSQSITCNRTNPGAWEFFTVTNLGGTNSQPVFALRANNGRFLVVQSDGTVRATGTNANASSARFRTIYNSITGFTVFRSISTGRLLSSENGTRTLRANRSSVGAWELFGIDIQ